jgi:hypothetical protein
MPEAGTAGKSKYKPVATLEFKSKIPPHLLAVLDDQERYMVESMSKLEQRNEWLEIVATENREAVIDFDERLSTLEKWKEMLTNKWAVVAYVALVCVPVLIKVLLEKWIK